jgi:4-amino-4-deoxy-L-arabinose transferase-like glycosyltransferase
MLADPAPSRAAIKREAASVAIVAAITGMICLFHLGAYGLWEPDEGRYAEIARETLVLHDLVVPHLNYVPYIEKPPLLYWLTALAMRLFGINEFAARSVNAAAAFATVMFVNLFARRAIDSRHALWSSLILSTSVLFALMAQVLTTDMLLTSAVTLALFAFFLHWREGGRWCWVMYVAIAMAILTKGPVGLVLPAAAGGIFLLVEGEWRGALERFHMLYGFSLIVVIVAPWFACVSLRQSGFLDFYFVGEHYRRFLESSYSHGEPLYYYMPVILAGTLPWSIFVPFLPWRTLVPDAARRFCLISTGTIFAFFSIASAKLIPYILPAIPPLAIVIASGLLGFIDAIDDPAQVGLRRSNPKRFAAASALLSLTGAGVMLVALLANRFASPNPMLVRPALYLAGAILLGAGVTSLVAFWHCRLILGLGTIVTAATATLIIASYGRMMAEPLRSYAQLARTIAARAPGARLVCYPRYIQSLPFYTQRRVILIGPQTELAYGAAHSQDGAQFFFSRRADLLRLWMDAEPTVLIADRSAFASLASGLGPYRVIAEDARKIAVTRADSALREVPSGE